MGQEFALDDFLVPAAASPEKSRETVASILVNQGTTPNSVVIEALEWIKAQADPRNYDITWYTPGALVPTTLRDCREKSPECRSATKLFLFPGRVDHDQEAVAGDEPVRFASDLRVDFSYALLSAHAFDIQEGTAYFHYNTEVALQRACAQLYATHKFLFLDSSKFKREGNHCYTIRSLLLTSMAVTIYTVSSGKDDWLKAQFESLSTRLGLKVLDGAADYEASFNQDFKTLRLRIVGAEGGPTAAQDHTDTLIARGGLAPLKESA